MFIKDPYSVLAEACRSECGECDDVYDNDIESELESEYDDTEELEDDLQYTEEMVTVIEQSTNTGVRYLVEMDILGKFMESSNITDVQEALDRIARINAIDESAMYIVIESQQYAEELLKEAKAIKKKTGSKEDMKKVSKSAKLLKELKEKGIKVLKKKSKKNKK